MPDLLGFQEPARQLRLADDRRERPDSQLGVIGNGNGDGLFAFAPWHNDVTSTLADFGESVFRKDAAGLSTGENAEPSQPPPRSA